MEVLKMYGYEISSDWYYKKYYETYEEPENSGDDFYDDFDPFGEDEIEKEEIAKAFKSTPKHGVYAHAYNKKLDNWKIKKMREKRYTLRAIAKQLGCSPNTIRNRLKKMGIG